MIKTNRAILISIRPQYVADILNGKKTLELRKTFPHCNLPIDVYIYCTKKGALLFKEHSTNTYWAEEENKNYRPKYALNGLVVAKFTLNKIDEHHVLPTERILPFNGNVEQKLDKLCLSKQEVMDYGKGQDYQAFLWHIDNLVIFNKPLLLNEHFFNVPSKADVDWFKQNHVGKGIIIQSLLKAPQSWQFVEVDL